MRLTYVRGTTNFEFFIYFTVLRATIRAKEIAEYVLETSRTVYTCI